MSERAPIIDDVAAAGSEVVRAPTGQIEMSPCWIAWRISPATLSTSHLR